MHHNVVRSLTPGFQPLTLINPDNVCMYRLFAVLVRLSQQSPSIELVFTSFLSLLDGLLPLKDLKVDIASVDLALIGWLLLLLGHVLDTCIVQCKPSVSGTG